MALARGALRAVDDREAAVGRVLGRDARVEELEVGDLGLDVARGRAVEEGRRLARADPVGETV